jgi:Opacity protein and related surface antigens
MKRTLFVLAVCLVMGTAAKAQNWADWSYGVKGGLNFASVTGDDNGKMKFSFNLGAFAEYRFNDFFGIQPELMYSRQGAYDKVAGVKQWERLNYINIPILAKLYVLDNLSVDIGPQIGILLHSKSKWKSGGSSGKNDIDGLKGADVSFAMGLTYRVDRNWDVNVRYNLGLTDVQKKRDGKNSVVQLGVGYRF